MCAHWYPEGYVLPTSTAYPPGPYHPAYTEKMTNHSRAPKPWYDSQLQHSSQEPKLSSTRTSRTSSSGRTQSTSSSASPTGHIIAGISDPGLVSGVDYFKIGDTVRVRRLTSANTYTDWAYGQVIRPHLKQYRTTEPERVYYVSYVDPRNGERKENEFSCHRKEIATLYERGLGSQPSLVFALVPLGSSSKWVPANIIHMSASGVDVRAVSKHLQHGYPTHFRGVQVLVPYNASVVRSLKAAGHEVVGDGR
ncbi:hypothetical protein F5050DRAFT_1741784 [Lentinula boryana]|uniref:Uncharacterized protein n=1 Tax=Lentinula boryana TaxID=40481 RepID=A0ABQ8QJZ5_9AGAR|nr:hypothetical protein F5050DRAFT_1741784 [Lentinula boryana]